MTVNNTLSGVVQYFENCTVLFHSYKNIIIITSPILLLVGTVGNIVSLLVLLRKNMRKRSTYNYLAILSIADTCVLYFGLLQYYLEEGYGYTIVSSWGCKLLHMIKFTVTDYSVWLIIAVTVERYIATVYPLHTAVMCTQKRAALVMSAMLIMLMIINSHFLFSVKSVTIAIDGDIYTQCRGLDMYDAFITNIWPFIDAVIYSVVPFIIIVVLNTVIIVKVKKTHKYIMGVGSAPPREMVCDIRLTTMLLLISFVFLITTVPVNVTMIMISFIEQTDLCFAARTKVIKTCTIMLMYTNHSINVFLYLLAGRKFRRELDRFIGCILVNKPKSQGSTYTIVTRVSTKRCAKPGETGF